MSKESDSQREVLFTLSDDKYGLKELSSLLLKIYPIEALLSLGY